MTRHDDSSHSTERIPVHDPAGFAPDISPDEWVASVRAAHIKLPPIWNQPFEVLQPSHLVGRARTNTTLVDPTVVPTDVQSISAPFPTFDMRKAALRWPRRRDAPLPGERLRLHRHRDLRSKAASVGGLLQASRPNRAKSWQAVRH